jgi:hypothetical protein
VYTVVVDERGSVPEAAERLYDEDGVQIYGPVIQGNP